MTRHDKNDAGRFFETASKEELIEYLVKTIHNEVSKGDDADCDLVRECSDWLDELTEDEIVFTPEELERNLEKIKAKTVSDKPVKIRKKVAWKKFVRVALIAAVIFTISLLSLSAVASNKGYDSAWEYMSEVIDKIFGLSLGEEINDDSITIIKNSDAIKYDNITAFLDKESINILYPTALPNSIKINTILYIDEDESLYTLSFVFSSENYKMYISNYYLTDKELLIDSELVTINDVTYYITKKDNSVFHAMCQYNGFEYTIQCDDYDNLVYIINHMKG